MAFIPVCTVSARVPELNSPADCVEPSENNNAASSPASSSATGLVATALSSNTSKASAGETARVSLRASLTRRWPTQTRANKAQARLRAVLEHEQIKHRQNCARAPYPPSADSSTSLPFAARPFAARPFPVSHSTSTLHVDVVPAATVCPVGSGRVFWMIPSHSTIRSLCTHRIDANTSKASAGKTARVSLRASLTRRWPTQTRANQTPAKLCACPLPAVGRLQHIPSLCCPSLCCPSLPCGLASARICAPSVHSARIGSTPTRPFPLLPFPSCLRTIR